jgi:hypothetical protein
VPENQKTQSHSLSRIASWGRPVSALLPLWGVILHRGSGGGLPRPAWSVNRGIHTPHAVERTRMARGHVQASSGSAHTGEELYLSHEIPRLIADARLVAPFALRSVSHDPHC